MQLTEAQEKQLKAQGISKENLQKQLENFKNGFPFAQLNRAAIVGDGIHRFSEEQQEKYIEIYEELAPYKEIVKFVPASGAASRMFKHLFQAIEEDGEITDKVQECIDGLADFAFYGELKELLAEKGTPLNQLLEDGDKKKIIANILLEDGMNYGQLPKALLKFHVNDGKPTTALEEQLFEGVEYAKSQDNRVRLHFTISPEHTEKVEGLLSIVGPEYEERFGVSFEIVLTNQSKSTDTVAVNLDNSPFIQEDGSMLFRPGGHGALIENLNQESADVIFIKNIDNVVPEEQSKANTQFKKLLGGLLLSAQSEIHNLLERLETEDFSDEHAQAIRDIGKRFFFSDWKASNSEEALKLLNKPIRVCGMVKNEGEPGGGPFWVDSHGQTSLQIVESSQIDLENDSQKKIMEESTHFNPVDLVCATRDFKGDAYDLLQFRDEQTGFITEKSVAGKTVKAQELPGLWNGAMANWNTLFVEVPIATFNPVKTLNDLLKAGHQSK